MMSSAREHRAKAEQLLEEAHATHDQIGRSLILAEAQVHATLALSAPAGKGPPGPGQDEADSTESTLGADSGMPEGSDEFQVKPHGSSARTGRGEGGVRTRPETAPGQPVGRGQVIEPVREHVPGKRTPTAKPSVRPEAKPRGDTAPSPSAENQRPEQDPDPGEQKPHPEGQSPAAGDPGDQKPADFTF
jgi:hypothetical protein